MEDGSFPRGRPERKEQPVEKEEKNRKRHRHEKRDEKKEPSSEKRPPSDFLFGGPVEEVKDKKKSTKKKRKQSPERKEGTTSTKSLLPLGGGSVVHPSKGESWIEGLGFTKLAKGFKLLGCVREVHEDLAIFSLPNLWTAYMLRQEDIPCSSMLVVGQFVSVVIVKAVQEHTADGVRRRIQVSCLPAAINPVGVSSAIAVPGTKLRCQIHSIEDHGILMDLGAGRQGFLPFSEIQEEYSIEEEEDAGRKLRLTEGRILDCLVNAGTSKNIGVISLSLPSRKKMAKHFLPAAIMPTLGELQPGMLVHAKVETVVRNGLCVTFCGDVFRGAIEVQHLGAFWVPEQRQESTEWKEIFENNRSLIARIIAVDTATKIIRLSLVPAVLELQLRNEHMPAVGSVIEEATVIRLDPGIGALLALPLEEDVDTNKPDSFLFKPISPSEDFLKATHVRAVYVHISKAVDKEEKGKKTPEALFGKEFAPSTKHRVRILSASNWIDGIASAAAAPSIVDAHVLTYADLIPGKVFKQVPVCAVLDGGGVLVDLGMGVRGLIPVMHLFDKAVTNDFRQQMLKVKYSVGAKVDVRVLTVDQRTKKCLLTAKKSIVKAERAIASFDDVRLGDIGTGFISKVDDRGISVTFFNNVFGRVTAHSLAAELGVENHQQNYAAGDVVECKVIHIKKRSKRNSSRADVDSDEEMDEADAATLRYYRELTLSLKLDGDISPMDVDDEGQAEEIAKASKIVQLRVGQLLPIKSMRIVELVDGKDKEEGFVPGYAIVSIKSQYLVDEAESATMVPNVECKLPFDQLLDDYNDEDIKSAASLDKLAKLMLTVGKKVNRKGFILSDAKKARSEYQIGTGKLVVVSIRPKLVEALEQQRMKEGQDSDDDPVLPSPDAHLFAGALLLGYVANIDPRHGAFVRYLNGLTGLIPKLQGGLLLSKFKTVLTQVLAVDTLASPPKLLVTASIKKGNTRERKAEFKPSKSKLSVKVGDIIEEAVVKAMDFSKAVVEFTEGTADSPVKVNATLHVTMADSKPLDPSSKTPNGRKTRKIGKGHPFYEWKVGQKLAGLRVLRAESKHGTHVVELTNRDSENGKLPEIFLGKEEELKCGQAISGIVTSVVPGFGLWLQISPEVRCYVPALEISKDVEILNFLQKKFPVGCRLNGWVMDRTKLKAVRAKYLGKRKQVVRSGKRDAPFVTLLDDAEKGPIAKASQGDLIVGKIDRSLFVTHGPALMLDIRGGYVGRCCITELDEPDNWENMPLGRETSPQGKRAKKTGGGDMEVGSGDEDDASGDEDEIPSGTGLFPHGRFVQCRVLQGVATKPIVEVSLRESRIKGDLNNDKEPEQGAKVPAYVVSCTKKGCFLRLSREIEGRVLLKELCDGFLPHPEVAFPPGRLVIGKVKSVKADEKSKHNKSLVDLDMRESVLLENELKLKFDDIKIGQKYKGHVSRIEDYGVFVKLANSDISGLVHKSECSDNFVKDLSKLYDHGDLVKVLAIKKDDEKKTVGLSMKASHFVGDDDSDDDSSVEQEGSSSVELVEDGDLNSDDENYVSKLAATVSDEANSDESTSNDDDSEAESDSDEDDDGHVDDNSGVKNNDLEAKIAEHSALNTDVGFDWGGGVTKTETHKDDSDDEESSESENEDDIHKSSHKSRRKQAQRRREEQEVSRRELALADGTADESPETAADFERLLASNPNSSEIWIKFMAFHLSLADVAGAREVANRAFDRIEFREEREKLNVWCALLTLEVKYGAETSLQETIDRACQHNNPKLVYLRLCEILEKDPSTSREKTDEMYAKMCKKFKSKKKVWFAHMEYLLKNGRQEHAHELSKRAVQSLPPYKHVETMSKFAQLEFEFGSPERARTLFDGLLQKYPKRLDLFFVYADKEVKHGDVATTRALFERVANPADQTLQLKLSDKQMKSFFKKWYAFEEQHGTEQSQNKVKEAARQYVERSVDG